jgi:hypothetical protein
MQSPPILEKVIQSAIFFQIQISFLLVHFVGGSKQRYNKGDKPDFIPLSIVVDSIHCHNSIILPVELRTKIQIILGKSSLNVNRERMTTATDCCLLHTVTACCHCLLLPALATGNVAHAVILLPLIAGRITTLHPVKEVAEGAHRETILP